jgi:hypothetical protein
MQRMQIDMHDVVDVRVFRVEGKHATKTMPEAGRQLGDALEQSVTKILIGFEGRDFVSRAGLRARMATTRKLDARRRALRICEPARDGASPLRHLGLLHAAPRLRRQAGRADGSRGRTPARITASLPFATELENQRDETS